MFGKIIRSFRVGKRGADAIHVLMKTYSLEVSHQEHLDMMHQIALDFGDLMNEHDLAIMFLARFSSTIKTDHPQAEREIKKYIRMSKGSYNRGLARSSVALEQLFDVIRNRFNIDPDQVEAA